MLVTTAQDAQFCTAGDNLDSPRRSRGENGYVLDYTSFLSLCIQHDLTPEGAKRIRRTAIEFLAFELEDFIVLFALTDMLVALS